MTGMKFPQVDELVGSGIVPLRGLRTVVGVTEADQGDTATSTTGHSRKKAQSRSQRCEEATKNCCIIMLVNKESKPARCTVVTLMKPANQTEELFRSQRL